MSSYFNLSRPVESGGQNWRDSGFKSNDTVEYCHDRRLRDDQYTSRRPLIRPVDKDRRRSVERRDAIRGRPVEQNQHRLSKQDRRVVPEHIRPRLSEFDRRRSSKQNRPVPYRKDCRRSSDLIRPRPSSQKDRHRSSDLSRSRMPQRYRPMPATEQLQWVQSEQNRRLPLECPKSPEQVRRRSFDQEHSKSPKRDHRRSSSDLGRHRPPVDDQSRSTKQDGRSSVSGRHASGYNSVEGNVRRRHKATHSVSSSPFVTTTGADHKVTKAQQPKSPERHSVKIRRPASKTTDDQKPVSFPELWGSIVTTSDEDQMDLWRREAEVMMSGTQTLAGVSSVKGDSGTAGQSISRKRSQDEIADTSSTSGPPTKIFINRHHQHFSHLF